MFRCVLILAAQRFADYENEIRVLEAKLRQEQRKNATPTVSEATDGSQAQPQHPGISRFGSFIGGRKPAPNQQHARVPSAGSREKELEEKFVKEQTARIAAEKKVKDTQADMEELSASLFQQANEMVAAEKKENAALREKMQQIEHLHNGVKETDFGKQNDASALENENLKLKEKLKTLEQRDAERKKRLERLEAASRRIERVKAMLQPP